MCSRSNFSSTCGCLGFVDLLRSRLHLIQVQYMLSAYCALLRPHHIGVMSRRPEHNNVHAERLFANNEIIGGVIAIFFHSHRFGYMSVLHFCLIVWLHQGDGLIIIVLVYNYHAIYKPLAEWINATCAHSDVCVVCARVFAFALAAQKTRVVNKITSEPLLNLDMRKPVQQLKSPNPRSRLPWKCTICHWRRIKWNWNSV
jgi:hypothetical protein